MTTIQLIKVVNILNFVLSYRSRYGDPEGGKKIQVRTFGLRYFSPNEMLHTTYSLADLFACCLPCCPTSVRSVACEIWTPTILTNYFV
jgi:hypothetical protein